MVVVSSMHSSIPLVLPSPDSSFATPHLSLQSQNTLTDLPCSISLGTRRPAFLFDRTAVGERFPSGRSSSYRRCLSPALPSSTPFSIFPRCRTRHHQSIPASRLTLQFLIALARTCLSQLRLPPPQPPQSQRSHSLISRLVGKRSKPP